MTASEWTRQGKLIVIVRGLKTEYMLPLADALCAGGIGMMEVTYLQDRPETWKNTAAAIRNITAHMDGRMSVGAGTVLTAEQLDMARDAGAKFIVTPNTDSELIRKVKEYGLLSFPGALTPSEIVNAWKAGADAVKVFPAGNMGPAYMKSITAPLSHIPLFAVGGITEENAADFMTAGCCGLGIGGSLINRKWIENGEWDQITALAAKYRKVVDRI